MSYCFCVLSPPVALTGLATMVSLRWWRRLFSCQVQRACQRKTSSVRQLFTGNSSTHPSCYLHRFFSWSLYIIIWQSVPVSVLSVPAPTAKTWRWWRSCWAKTPWASTTRAAMGTQVAVLPKTSRITGVTEQHLSHGWHRCLCCYPYHRSAQCLLPWTHPAGAVSAGQRSGYEPGGVGPQQVQWGEGWADVPHVGLWERWDMAH